ncbi:YybH family protein [Shewanella waksmanii]|uniref:YybH family protein n=1 Tax=Shewanella waksmanii TaxID=213783 RepID=UPI003736FB3D
MIKKAFGLLLICLAASVQAVPSDDIAEILAQQEAAWNRGDLDNYMRGYWNNEKLRFVSGNKFSYGWEKTLAAYKKNYPDVATLGKLKFTIEETKMLSNYAALVVGRWELKRAKDNPNGVFTLLVERIDDRWVITHDHSSD